MNGGLIPYRYAKALYKFASEQNVAPTVYNEMQSLAIAFNSSQDFQKILSNPFADPSDKKKLLLAAAGSDPSEAYKGFVRLILDKKRTEFAHSMALAYEDIFRKAAGISSVAITTATELPDQEIEKLKKLISKAFPGRTLEFTQAINPDIIGGFIIDVDHVRMDASVSNEIEKLRLTLISTN